MIDMFSKYLFVVPVKTKSAVEVCNAIESILKKRKPTRIRSDRGKEFNNSHFKNLCAKYGIKFMTTTNQTIKCAGAERVNLTLRNKIQPYLSHRGNWRYIDDLQKLVKGYNESVHRMTKMPPAEVDVEDEQVVFENLYGAKNMLELWKQNKLKQPKLNVRDQVRQKFDLGPLEKSYHQRWSDIVYKIEKVLNKLNIPQFIVSLNGEQLERRFYPSELQRVIVPDDSLFLVEKVERYKTVDQKRYAFVKWKGYPRTFNEWVPVDQIQKL